MTRERNLRLATIALVGAGVLFSYAFVRALVVDPPPAVPDAAAAPPALDRPAAPAPSVEAPLSPLPTPARKWTGLTTNALQLAVETDPFQPDRVRAPERYRLPSEEVFEEEMAPPLPPPPPPQFRVLGTIASTGGGVAVIQTPTGSRVLGIGESLNGFTLASVTPRNATVEGNGGRRYSLAVEDAAPTRSSSRGARGRANAPAAGRGSNAEQAAQLRATMERLRQMGMGGAALEQMQRVFEQINRDSDRNGRDGRGGRGERGETIEIVRPGPGAVVSGDRIIIRPRVDTMMVPSNRQND